MEAGRRTLGLLVLLLAFGVAVKDAPEISSLLDDYSNDGMTVYCQDSIPQVSSHRRSRRETTHSTSSRPSGLVHLRRHAPTAPIIVPPYNLGKGRLHFLSLLRD